ncbi:hypothetical protein SLNWT_5062 [Streptomyces albus]|uniref:Uncharacterized protein n=1 Tax=Streptomyces albus (strain ATCC 21838 / DSM 41398 / FERM P-419 / JCM 4703 / NBRC 107858) TaxID=1081613 RepID=A0A0B5ERJ4_STRA4|nr:hypothetical protein SLNWT_5062 [Streptomyces albus]AOU79742.1 hypothetical protein SLNHY_5051 [Streptomyces albus]AYN35466.1 hypothetical protein DUI70_4968 [Streptomyces albus]
MSPEAPACGSASPGARGRDLGGPVGGCVTSAALGSRVRDLGGVRQSGP